MSEEMTTEQLTNLVDAIARIHGFDEGYGSFYESTDLKVKWEALSPANRPMGIEDTWLRVDMSDLLATLSEDAVTDYIDAIASAVAEGRGWSSIRCPESVIEEVASREWCADRQALVLKRRADLSESGKGEHVDLDALYRKLVYEGYTSYDPLVKLRWADMGEDCDPDRAVRDSTAFKLVMVNRKLDMEGIDEDALACALLFSLTKIELGIAAHLRGELTWAATHAPQARHPSYKNVLLMFASAGIAYPKECDCDEDEDEDEDDDEDYEEDDGDDCEE